MFTARTTARKFAPVLLAVAVLGAGSSTLHAQAKAKLNQFGYPAKLTPKATSPAITSADLMTRLYIFADDSMQGRQIGREGNMKGTAYIARELKRLGVEPAGDNGTYFQALVPGYALNSAKGTLTVDGRALSMGSDFTTAPIPQIPAAGQSMGMGTREITNAQVIFGGFSGDSVATISAEQAAGKVVILVVRPPQQGAGQGRAGGGGAGRQGGAGAPNPNAPATKFARAAAIATINLDGVAPAAIAMVANPTQAQRFPATAPSATAPIALRLSGPGATALLGGKSLDGIKPGTTGGTVNAKFEYMSMPKDEYARNVVGIIRGSDPKLKGQFVAVGAHNDHIGFGAKVDHDSAYAARHALMKMRIVGKDTIRAITPEMRAAAEKSVNVDSLHRIRPARLDSISNGADDDGSGSMAVLEIAEAIQKSGVKPKRSIIFVWHTGEEAGLLGSAYFATHPTVAKDSIVAQINIDMIGRGRAEDLPGGGPDYVGVVGANMMSADLGQMVQSVNKKQAKPLILDDRYDGNVIPTLGQDYNNIYGRSDHANYARQGIPIAFFFTGLHGDYHQTTDEPQYIDYPHYARITNYVKDLVVEVGNNPKRPAITKPVM